MPEMNAARWIKDWFRDRNPDAVPGEADHFLDGGVIDSFGMIELIEGIERQFSIRFDQHDFQNPGIFTIAGLAEMIAAKMGGAPAAGGSVPA